ncbi:MAG: hypothetical protein ACR2LL_02390 [Nitrosopumilus sp.]
MKQQLINTWEHSPSKTQAAKVPVKEVPSLLQNTTITPKDLMGLSWTLFEEDSI